MSINSIEMIEMKVSFVDHEIHSVEKICPRLVGRVVGVAETVLVRSQIIEVRSPDTPRLGSSQIVRTGGTGCLALAASFTFNF